MELPTLPMTISPSWNFTRLSFPLWNIAITIERPGKCCTLPLKPLCGETLVFEMHWQLLEVHAVSIWYADSMLLWKLFPVLTLPRLLSGAEVMDQIPPYRFALLNAHSLGNKSLIIKDYFIDNNLHLLFYYGTLDPSYLFYHNCWTFTCWLLLY